MKDKYEVGTLVMCVQEQLYDIGMILEYDELYDEYKIFWSLDNITVMHSLGFLNLCCEIVTN